MCYFDNMFKKLILFKNIFLEQDSSSKEKYFKKYLINKNSTTECYNIK